MRSICYIQGEDPEEVKKKKKMKINEDGEEEEDEEEEEEEDEEPECEDGINRMDMLITGSFDGTARCWSMERGKQIKVGQGGVKATTLSGIRRAEGDDRH